MNISQNTLDFLNEQEQELKDIFHEIDLNCEKTSLKVFGIGLLSFIVLPINFDLLSELISVNEPSLLIT